MQFTGIVKSFDADEGFGYIVREPDRHEVAVRSAGLALGAETLSSGDRVQFDIDMGTTRRRGTWCAAERARGSSVAPAARSPAEPHATQWLRYAARA